MTLKNSLIIVASVFIYTAFSISTYCFANMLSDEDMKAKLIAVTWVNREEAPGMVSERTYTFYPDNTFWKRGTISKGEEIIEIDYKGKYSIENGLITEIVTDSNRPDLIPVSKTTTDKIIDITEQDFIYETNKGKEVRFKRIK